MEFSRRSRIGALAVLLVLVGGVTSAAVLTDHTASTAHASRHSATKAGIDPMASAPPDTTPARATDPDVQKQLDYVLAHWKNYNLGTYGQMGDNDCVNFTSQSLVARGWKMDDQWWTSGTGANFEYSSPWVSSTAFRDYLQQSGRATALTDAQRDQVKLGDVVQFDWDGSGDRDHTGVVTRIEHSGGKTLIYYAGHTDDTDYRSVDWAITVNHPGASVYYWSIPAR